MNILTDFTPGNWITLIAAAVGFIIGWARIKDRSDENRRRIEQLEEQREIDRRAVAEIHAEIAGIAATLSGIRDQLRDQRRHDDR